MEVVKPVTIEDQPRSELTVLRSPAAASMSHEDHTSGLTGPFRPYQCCLCLCHVYAQVRTLQPGSLVLPEECSGLEERRPKSCLSPTTSSAVWSWARRPKSEVRASINGHEASLLCVCFSENQHLHARSKVCTRIKAPGKGVDIWGLGRVLWKRAAMPEARNLKFRTMERESKDLGQGTPILPLLLSGSLL